MGKKILIVEDDKNISKLIQYNLEKAGFICIQKFTGEDALDFLDKESVDLVILDIMLSGMDGFEVCKELKQNPNTSFIPVLILTAKSEEIDRVLGFELGADDYVVKPFSTRELILRVKSIIKRFKKTDFSDEQVLSYRNLTLDSLKHKIMIDNKTIELTPMEFKLLSVLIKRQDRVQSRDNLLNDVWGITAEVTTRTVDTHIKKLRKKIGKLGRFIKTIRGLGYKLEADD